jgi:hypothetical protein
MAARFPPDWRLIHRVVYARRQWLRVEPRGERISAVDPFAALLQLFQERWPAQRAIARQAGVDHARYNRLVRGDVAPANRQQVLAIAGALRLNPLETDQLVAAAGYLPPSLSRGSISDPTLRAVLAVLRHPSLPNDERDAFQSHVEQAARWLLAAYPGGDPSA